MFLNLPIFAQNVVCYHGNRGLAEKSSIFFLLIKTHSIPLAEKNSQFAQFKKLFYLPAMCGLNYSLNIIILNVTKSDCFSVKSCYVV